MLRGGGLTSGRFANDPGFKKRQASSKKNRASSKGGCLHTGGSVTIPKTRARMTRSLDRLPTDVEVFRETHTRKRDRSIVEKHAEDLLAYTFMLFSFRPSSLPTEFSANLDEATQRAQEEGDKSPATVDPNIVWRQTLSEPYKNRVYGAGGFFASSLRRSGYADSSASASSCHTDPPAPEVVDLREQVQNLTQSLQSQGDLLQQQIDEVKSLKSTLAEKDAWAEEHLRRMEEMSRMMAAYYGPLRPGSSGSGAGLDSMTAPPLPPRPPPQHPHPEGVLFWKSMCIFELENLKMLSPFPSDLPSDYQSFTVHVTVGFTVELCITRYKRLRRILRRRYLRRITVRQKRGRSTCQLFPRFASDLSYENLRRTTNIRRKYICVERFTFGYFSDGKFDEKHPPVEFSFIIQQKIRQ
ncbi:hypothetical protein PIB30_022642 [Stylosanthes scabra]|uniref:Uncharacterized protein n=1 Tax=Stylosanthes scabra TaxID=79078 RepID=A0ABU6TAW7_9FABA|nr:hypothetical protein [Stylosanthes scabra]